MSPLEEENIGSRISASCDKRQVKLTICEKQSANRSSVRKALFGVNLVTANFSVVKKKLKIIERPLVSGNIQSSMMNVHFAHVTSFPQETLRDIVFVVGDMFLLQVIDFKGRGPNRDCTDALNLSIYCASPLLGDTAHLK